MNTPSPIYAIGDIHGELAKLTTLISRCEQHAGGRSTTFVFLGDYIDRGPDSAGAIRTLMGLQSRPRTRVIALRGNVRQRRTGSVGIISRRNEFLLPGDLTLELIGVTRYCVNLSQGDSRGSPAAVGAAPRANIRSRFETGCP